jgi:hypothetical protein
MTGQTNMPREKAEKDWTGVTASRLRRHPGRSAWSIADTHFSLPYIRYGERLAMQRRFSAVDTGDTTRKPRLLDFRKTIHSQFGEDGIIEKIFEIIGTTSKVCVEFGAWDGFFLSNTAALWTKDWKGVLIEAEQNKFLALLDNVRNYSCVPILAKVGIDEDNHLETILHRRGITEPIDLLSIDIDGNDYYIFQSLTTLRPRVIICEYNPTMPAHIDIYPDYDNHTGCSVAALVRVARSKGYQLAALTEVNAFFVVEEEFAKLSSFETRLEQIRIDRHLTYLILSFSGEYQLVSLQSEPPFEITAPLRNKLRGTFHQPIPHVICSRPKRG